MMYNGDPDKINQTFLIMMGIAVALAAIVYVYRVYSWMKRNYNQMLNGSVSKFCLSIFL